MNTRVVHIVGSPGIDQADEVVLALMDMAAYGFEVAALVPPPNGLQRWHPYSGLAVGKIGYLPYLGSANPDSALAAGFLWLVQWLRSVSPDLVHGHGARVGPTVALAAASAGIPSVISLHPSNKGWSFPARLAAKRVNTVISHGNESKQLAGVERVEIPLGVPLVSPDHVGETRSAARRRVGYGDRIVLGLVFPRHSCHDIELVVEAFVDTAPNDCVLVLVGDGDSWLQLEAIHRNLGAPSSVTIETEIPEAEVIAACDLVVNADRLSGVNATTIRAAGLGIPTIGFDIGGATAWAKTPKLGRFVATKDRVGLASAIAEVVDLVRTGRARSSSDEIERLYRVHRVEAMAAATARLWRNIVEGEKSAEDGERPLACSGGSTPSRQ